MKKSNDQKIRMALAAFVLGALMMPAVSHVGAETYVGSDTVTVNADTKEIKVKNMAQSTTEDETVTTDPVATGTNAVAIGAGSSATGNYAQAFGTSATAGSEGAIAIGKSANATVSGNTYGLASGYTTAIGYEAVASGTQGTALGYQATASGVRALALGQGAVASHLQTTAVGTGAEASGVQTTAVGLNSEAGGAQSTAVGFAATASGNYSIALGGRYSDTSAGTKTLTEASGDYAVAIGNGAQATMRQAVAIGWLATASSDETVSIGRLSKASGSESTAVGGGVTAAGMYSTALGNAAEASGQSTVALGSASVSMGDSATALGNSAKAYARASIAIGMNATVGIASDTNDDGSSKGNQQGDSQYGIAIGDGSQTSGFFAMAAGPGAYAGNSFANAIGYQSYANATGAVAIGMESVSTKARATETLKDGSTAKVSTVSFGHQNGDTYQQYSEGSHAHTGEKIYSGIALSRLTNVAYGQDDYDAATYGQIAKEGQEISLSTDARDDTKTEEGKKNEIVANDGTVLATFTKMETVSDTDMGFASGVDLYNETRENVSGTYILADQDVGTNLSALDTAIGKTEAGKYISAQDGNTVTVATNLKALDDKSVKKDHPAIELASGSEGELKANDDTTLAMITIKDGTVEENDKGYTTGDTVYKALSDAATEQEKLIKLDGTQIVIGGDVTADTVSVGKSGAERKIVNVAYGEDNHDAATMGQLIASATNATSDDKTKAQTATLAFKDEGLESLTIEVPGQGTVASDDVRLISGATLYGENRNAIATTNQTLHYISNQDAASNLLALDQAIGKTEEGKYISAQDGNTVTVATNLKALDDKSVKKDHPAIELASGSEGELKANDDTTLAMITIKDGTVEENDKGYTTGDTVYKALSDAATEQEKLIKLDGTQIVIGGDVTADTVSVGKSGAERTISNVKAGSAGTDAVNKSQLDAAIAGTNYTAGNDYVTIDQNARTVSVNATGAIDSGNSGLVTGGKVYDAIVANDTYKLNDDKKTITVKNGANGTAFTLDLDGLAGEDGVKYEAGNHISISSDNKISVTANGTVTSGNSGLVTGGTVYAAIQTQMGQMASYTGDDETISVGSDKKISVKTGEIGAGVKSLITGETAYNALVANDTYKLNDDKKTITVRNGKGGTAFTLNLDGLSGGSGVTYEAGDNISISSDNKISVVTDGKIESRNSGIVTGGAIYEKVGDTAKLTEAGLGENLTDSVLHVNSRIGALDSDISKVGAGAAALAALHPEDFNPADKVSFALGYGHYRGTSAGAFGIFYKPNADTTFSAGATIGNSDSMMNAGVSFKFGSRGQAPGLYSSNAELVREVNALRADNEALKADNARIKEDNAKIKADNERMKQQIALILLKMEMADVVSPSAMS